MNADLDFSRLVNDNKLIIIKICRIYSDNEDDFNDLFQEVVIQLWKSYKSFRGDSKLSTWIYRVALNTSISYIKLKNRRVATISFSTPHHAVSYQDYDSTLDDEVKALYKAIQMLKEGDRAIVTLYLEEKSYDEISEIVGITPNNVGVKINRIKKQLFTLLNDLKDGR
jgi:RNA polymerase sigma-70 factor, ECF subfamily